jgi:hypothetical protein
MQHPTLQYLDRAISQVESNSLENGFDPTINTAEVLEQSPNVMRKIQQLIRDIKESTPEMAETHVLWFLADMQQATNALAFHQFTAGEPFTGEELTN